MKTTRCIAPANARQYSNSKMKVNGGLYTDNKNVKAKKKKEASVTQYCFYIIMTKGCFWAPNAPIAANGIVSAEYLCEH